jgi:hypothetical protein
MGLLLSIITGLLTALIGYIVGRVWQKFIDHAHIVARGDFGDRYWAKSSRSSLVVFQSDTFVEPTGIVGGGDALALREISSYFAKIGLERANVVYVDEASLDRGKNLILLGGLDTNVDFRAR